MHDWQGNKVYPGDTVVTYRIFDDPNELEGTEPLNWEEDKYGHLVPVEEEKKLKPLKFIWEIEAEHEIYEYQGTDEVEKCYAEGKLFIKFGVKDNMTWLDVTNMDQVLDKSLVLCIKGKSDDSVAFYKDYFKVK